MKTWPARSIFYHIYPLGCCGAPLCNDFNSPPTERLKKLYGWLPHFKRLGINALYLGPVFESTAHGYDTADFFTVDRRLGINDTLRDLIVTLRQQNIRVILDGVFHHVGRDFWAFRDVRLHGQASRYCEWFTGLSFDGQSPYKDCFTYEGWKGHYDLVKLNLSHPAVRQHLFKAVEIWIKDLNIDGLRLDAADCIDKNFLQALAGCCKKIKPDFWLMGEVVAGDYRDWVNETMLDSVTNYVAYKGLYSSHVDRNYFEIAYTLNRQFSEEGIYKNLLLYTFADNHDVNRVASRLDNPAHLYPLYCLLFTMPGIPSIYYGSEWGLEGRKRRGSDAPLRPAIDLDHMAKAAPHPDLVTTIALLSAIHAGNPALQHGSYRQLHVASRQLAFARQADDQLIVVAINASDQPASFDIEIPTRRTCRLRDLLGSGKSFPVVNGAARIPDVPANWARVLIVE